MVVLAFIGEIGRKWMRRKGLCQFSSPGGGASFKLPPFDPHSTPKNRFTPSTWKRREDQRWNPIGHTDPGISWFGRYFTN